MRDFNQQVIDEFRANGGTVTTGGFGSMLVLLHSRGAKSGEERISPVFAITGTDDWRIIASAAGSPKNPAWYHNLKAQPEVTIETPEGSVDVAASEIPPDRWASEYAEFTSRSSGFRKYEETAEGRDFPIFRLTRR